MKRLAVITTSLLLTLAASVGGTAAFAEEAEKSETLYPEDFIKALSFNDLKDYDIEGDTYYFLDGGTYFRYENGELANEVREEFSVAQAAVTVNNSFTFRLTDSTLKVWDKDDVVTTFEGEYSLLKEFGDKAYAVKDNVLYCFDSAEQPAEVVPRYVDYSVTKNIKTGQSAKALENYEALTFVTIKQGAFMTAIDLTDLGGEYFTLENTEDVSANTSAVKEDTTALLLCYTGNAAIVSIGDTGYIVLNSPSTIDKAEVNCVFDAEFDSATITGNRIYASPFTVIGTTVLPNATGTIVTVSGKIEYASVLNSVYYQVEFATDDETVKTGYVAEGFLTEYIIEDDKPLATVTDPNHSEKTNVTTVLLILAVVVLVLIALGYVTYTATSGKKRKDKKQKNEDKEIEDNK